MRDFKRLWEGKCFFSFGGRHSRGVGILFRVGLDIKIDKYHFDSVGRLLVLGILYNNIKYKLVNVYAPNRESDRKEFITSLGQFLTGNSFLILGGDFNFVENTDLDKVGGNLQRGSVGMEEMSALKRDYNLVDLFRTRNPAVRAVSWSSNNISCRLDRFYIMNTKLDEVTNTNIELIDKHISDHALVWLEVLDDQAPQGPGYWKLNSNVLADPNFNPLFSQFWQNEISNVSIFDSVWWDNAKSKIKDFLIDQSKTKAQNSKLRLKSLREQLSMYRDFNLIQPGRCDANIAQVQNDIFELENVKMAGAKIRARVCEIYNSERPSRFFLQKELQRAEKKTIRALQDSTGHVLTSLKDIQKETHNFYSNLFQSEPIDHDIAHDFLSSLPKLPDHISKSLENPITKDECLTALKKMKNNKSPGADGLTKEFYLKVFSVIGEQFIQVLNHIFKTELLGPSQRHGLITLICKDPHNAESLKYWRPISLLNVDYKIISKVLSMRLGSVLADIIHFDQTCAVPNRSILDNAHLVRNITDYAAQKQIDLALVSLDQSKAFDRVSFNFLFLTLKKFGFGPNFIKWIKILYTDINSSIIVNGHFTDPVTLQRGVRQGCSLSPLLYVCFIESFAIAIRNNSLIKGLPLPGNSTEIKVSQYADDTTCIVRNSQSIVEVYKISNLFSKASGAKLNNDKSKGLVMGNFRITHDIPLQWVRTIKICGIWYGLDSYKYNWDNVIEKMKKTANLHLTRNLTFKGRALIAEVLLCSKLWYVGTVVPVEEFTIQQINKVIFSFIWANKVEKINRNTLYLSQKEGGLGVVHVSRKLASFRVKHILNLLNNPFVKWHSFCIYWLGIQLAKFKPDFRSNLIPHSFQNSKFYLLCMKDFKVFGEAVMKVSQPNQCLPKRTKIDPNQLIPQLRSTKECYTLLKKDIICIPRIVSKFPQIDFLVSFKANSLHYLDPYQRNLTWRMLHGILPVNTQLYRIGIQTNLECPHCVEHESIPHAFFNCLFVKPLWEYLFHAFLKFGFQQQQYLLSNNDNIKEDQIVFNTLKPDASTASRVCMIFIYTLRSVIWQVRNEVEKERKEYTTVNIVQKLMNNIKSRIQIDYEHLDLEFFLELWGQNRALVRASKTELWISY